MPKLRAEKFLNTRWFGLYFFSDSKEKMAGLAIWKQAIGIEWTSKEKKPRFSEKKFLNSVRECSETINQLNQSHYPHRHWGGNWGRSEADSSP